MLSAYRAAGIHPFPVLQMCTWLDGGHEEEDGNSDDSFVSSGHLPQGPTINLPCNDPHGAANDAPERLRPGNQETATREG